VTITTAGFDGAFNETSLSRILTTAGIVGYKHGVSDGGFTATAGGGTRQVLVSAGTAFVAGVYVNSDASTTLAGLAANAGSSARTDYVVLRLDWSTNTASIAVVQGTSGAAPALTQTAGTLWEMPLARVSVAPSATTLTNANITAAKPLPYSPRVLSGAVAPTTLAYNAGWTTVGSFAVPDPGWPYHLDTQALVRFGTTASGFGSVQVVDDAGTVLALGESANLSTTGTHSVVATGLVTNQTGAKTVSLQAKPTGMSTGSSLILQFGRRFSVTQLPA